MPETTLVEARAMADRNDPLPEDFYIDTNAEVQWKPGREHGTTDRMIPVSLDPCLEKREPDEPMFILLARDSAAPETIEDWCRRREYQITVGLRPDNDGELEHIAQVREKVAVFRAWRKAHRRDG